MIATMFLYAQIEPTPHPGGLAGAGLAFRVGNIATIVSILLLSLLFTSCARANSEEDLTWSLSNERLAENFRKIATENEYRIVEGIIQKWVSPINVFIANGDEGAINEVEEVFNLIRRTTKLTIIMDGPREEKNFFVVFAAAEEIPDFAEGLSEIVHQYSELYNIVSPYNEFLFENGRYCHGTYLADQEGRIKHAVVVIPIEYKGKILRACLVEEIVQSLGLPNDSWDVYPSIFNDNGEYNDLTAQDILFLKILYSDEVVNGRKFEYNKDTILRKIQEYREKRLK